MAAITHLSSGQLSMFLPAHVMMDNLGPADGVSTYSASHAENARAMAHKLEESINEGTYDDIAENGIQRPVNILKTAGSKNDILGNGHHRLVSAYENNPKTEVPVLHHDNYLEAMRGGYGHEHDDDDRPPRASGPKATREPFHFAPKKSGDVWAKVR